MTILYADCGIGKMMLYYLTRCKPPWVFSRDGDQLLRTCWPNEKPNGRKNDDHLLLRKISPEETDYLLTLVRAWPVQVPESSEEWRHKAAQVKAQTPLSVADAWIASLALLREAEMVHKDPEYDKVPNLLMLKLPYKV